MHEGEIELVIRVDDDPVGDIATIGGIDVEALRSEAHAHPGTLAGVVLDYLDQAQQRTWYIHKYEVSQEYGGAEEGGWWYTQGTPVEDWEVMAFPTDALAYEQCRILNDQERIRREKSNRYGPGSAVHELGAQNAPADEDPADTREFAEAYQSSGIADERYYTYTVETTSSPEEYPVTRPHYE